MKIDGFVKALLATIALLLAINCATNLPFMGGATQASAPAFLQVGKVYETVGGGRIKILRIDNSGWVQVSDPRRTHPTYWLNTNQQSELYEQ